jgi:hypothetical protein
MIKRALIVFEPYATDIVTGKKPIEYRSRPTNIRERIGIISAGTKTIIGEVDLVDCEETALVSRYFWILKNPLRYRKPKPYKHPQGAQVWVKVV